MEAEHALLEEFKTWRASKKRRGAKRVRPGARERQQALIAIASPVPPVPSPPVPKSCLRIRRTVPKAGGGMARTYGTATLAATAVQGVDCVEMLCYIGEDNVFGIVDVLAFAGVLGIIALVSAMIYMCFCVQRKATEPLQTVKNETVTTDPKPVNQVVPVRVETLILPEQVYVAASLASFPRCYHVDIECRQLLHAQAPVRTARLCKTCQKAHEEV